MACALSLPGGRTRSAAVDIPHECRHTIADGDGNCDLVALGGRHMDALRKTLRIGERFVCRHRDALCNALCSGPPPTVVQCNDHGG